MYHLRLAIPLCQYIIFDYIDTSVFAVSIGYYNIFVSFIYKLSQKEKMYEDMSLWMHKKRKMNKNRKKIV